MLLSGNQKNDASTSFSEKSSMATIKLASVRPVTKLIPQQIPDTEFSRLIAAGLDFGVRNPQILDAIDRDRDRVALAKKRERLKDQEWLASRGTRLPGFDVCDSPNWMAGLELGLGRERMPAIMVLLFILMRGYHGGFKDRKTLSNLLESRTLDIVLASFDLSMPGASTILDNVNAVSVATLELVVDAQIMTALSEGLDDFKKLTFDSTSVTGNTAFPTDSGTIKGLALRAEHLLRSLATHGITIKLPAVMSLILTSISDHHRQIQLTSGKKDSAKIRGKLYRKLMKAARKVRKDLLNAQTRAENKFAALDIIPSQKNMVMKIIQWIKRDLDDLGLAIINADKRINQNKKVPIEEKIVSISDASAAMIVKGQGDPKVGYKPQIGRSENGFVIAIIVPEGNAADSGQLRPIVDAARKRSGVLPTVLSFDDGYTNAKDREHYLGLEVEIVSFSGSKGKKLIPVEEYESDAYKQARNDRSAVESIMFTLKHNHDLDRVMRRGIENVRSELLEKVIAYNFFRLIRVRNLMAADKLAA